jgi:hypothetical protein
MTRSTVAEHLIKAWKRIPASVTEEAWGIFLEEEWRIREPEGDQRRDDDDDFQPGIFLHEDEN